MKKILVYAYYLIALVLFSFYGSTTCSETSNKRLTTYSHPKNSGKTPNFAEKKISEHTKRMLNTTTYQYGSFEHIRDLALLNVAPACVSQAILAQQRNNQLIFLEKNEENALEGVRNYWGLDKATWSDILEKNKQEHEFNLREMRKKTNHGGTFHNSSLPVTWTSALQYECRRHGCNPKNFNFSTTDDMNILACAFEKKQLPSGAYNPAGIDFNLGYAFRPQESIDDSAAHEFTHIIRGHSLRNQNIIYGAGEQIKKKIEHNWPKPPNIPQYPSRWASIINPGQFQQEVEIFQENLKEFERKLKEKEIFAAEQTEKIKAYSKSPAFIALTAAQEKTADTYIICIDPKAAQNVPTAVQYSGYTDNHNDMKVVHANWRATQSIENSKRLRRTLGSACGQQECTIL